MGEDDKRLCSHFYSTLQGGDNNSNFSFYVGQTKENVAPFNLPWLIDVRAIRESNDIPQSWGTFVRQNACENDERTKALKAMTEQRYQIFMNIIKPMGEQFINYIGGKSTSTEKLDFASHSLFYSLCEADGTSLEERLKNLFHVFFMGDAEEYKEIRKEHFSALRRLIADWVDAFLVVQYSDRCQHIDAATNIWLRCWLGFEALAFVLYRISGADEIATTHEAFGIIMVPSAVEGSLSEAMGKYFDGALKSEKRKKRQQAAKKKKLTDEDWKKADPSVDQLILVVEKSQLDRVVEYGTKLEDQILTRLSLFSKLTCMKMDRFRAVKKTSENDCFADKGCTDICQKYHLLIGRNLAEQEFLETCSAASFGRYENLLLELRNELLRMEQNCFCCDAGHGGHEAYREELEAFYCKGARGGNANSCKDPGYRHWGELYLYRVLKLLDIDPEQKLAEEVILPLRVFLSPLPTGWGRNRANREELEQAVLFLIHELGDRYDSYRLLAQHGALKYDQGLLSFLKNTKIQDALLSGEEVIENG